MNFGRIAGVIVGIMLVVAATLFFLFRYTFTTGRLYQVQTALGIDAPPPERHIVPEGFTGWALIHYGIEGAPKLPVVDGVTVAEYPESGRLETATLQPDNDGFINQDFFERRGDEIVRLTRLGSIWGEYNMVVIEDDDGDLIRRTAGFFVGTAAEFQEAERPLADIELPELPELPD
jgi:hypothetical protein